MLFDESVFKAYDIRGIARKQVTPELSMAVGRAFADWLPKAGPVAVGRDMRLDSGEIADALIEGLRRQGREVWDIGLVTSDMIYFAVGHHGLAGGAMVTASHNPGMDDGIKLCREEVKPLSRETGLLDLKKAIKVDSFKTAARPGGVTSMSVVEDWVKHCLGFVDAAKLQSQHIAIDAGNGMAGAILPSIEPKLPFKVERLYYDLDGNFPNHPANPLELANLQDLIKKIVSDKLDYGIAFDGDGDRAFLVDEKGEWVSGSALGALLAKQMLKRYPGSTVLYSALCSRTLPEVIAAAGGKPVKTRVGHTFIKADMRTHNAVFAAEHSGHYYFKDNYMADSGLITALVAMQAVSESGQPLSELIKPYRKYFSSKELNQKVDDIGAVVDLMLRRYPDGEQDVTDGLSIYYRDWWFNIRASNTEPVIRLNVEADDAVLLREKEYELLNILRS